MRLFLKFLLLVLKVGYHYIAGIKIILTSLYLVEGLAWWD